VFEFTAIWGVGLRNPKSVNTFLTPWPCSETSVGYQILLDHFSPYDNIIVYVKCTIPRIHKPLRYNIFYIKCRYLPVALHMLLRAERPRQTNLGDSVSWLWPEAATSIIRLTVSDIVKMCTHTHTHVLDITNGNPLFYTPIQDRPPGPVNILYYIYTYVCVGIIKTCSDCVIRPRG